MGVPLRVGLLRASLRFGASQATHWLTPPSASLTRFATRTKTPLSSYSLITTLKSSFNLCCSKKTTNSKWYFDNNNPITTLSRCYLLLSNLPFAKKLTQKKDSGVFRLHLAWKGTFLLRWVDVLTNMLYYWSPITTKIGQKWQHFSVLRIIFTYLRRKMWLWAKYFNLFFANIF